MRFRHLSEWLNWQETLHPNAIDPGLDRVRIVLQRMGWQPPPCPVITVAGTKGKGSCVALLESIYRAAGYRTGAFTSPHLLRYNERIRIAGRDVSDDALCAAFAHIDAVRGEISLTYFEFSTLAALWLFAAAQLDVWILEVGMGGRLDAVNVVDADVALVTSIGLDHTEWLGADLDSIAREKAGIYRAGRPALFGASEMPAAIAECAQAVGAPLLRLGHEFHCSPGALEWTWRMGQQQLERLPFPGIAGVVQLHNASSALAVVSLLSARLPVESGAIRTGLAQTRLPGRFQSHVDAAGTEWVLDVAHNALSAQVLARHLSQLPRRRTLAIFGVMHDKDVVGMVNALAGQVHAWLPVALPGLRAATPAVLVEQLQRCDAPALSTADDVASACALAVRAVESHGFERVLVLGSFLTVGPSLDWLGLYSPSSELH